MKCLKFGFTFILFFFVPSFAQAGWLWRTKCDDTQDMIGDSLKYDASKIAEISRAFASMPMSPVESGRYYPDEYPGAANADSFLKQMSDELLKQATESETCKNKKLAASLREDAQVLARYAVQAKELAGEADNMDNEVIDLRNKQHVAQDWDVKIPKTLIYNWFNINDETQNLSSQAGSFALDLSRQSGSMAR